MFITFVHYWSSYMLAVNEYNIQLYTNLTIIQRIGGT